MKSRISISLVVIVAIVVCISCSTQRALRRTLSSRGEIIKEYDSGDDYFLIMKEGNKIVKYRLFKYTGPIIGTGSEIVYSIDTFAQVCLTGSENQVLIDCEKIKNDPDIGQFITW